ncbi:sirtuin [Mycena latifolia]|nr:sirtuin [Mycena latifolia]
MSSMPSSDMAAFCHVMSSAKRVAILSGAGLSAASGIQTYRDSDALWTTTDPAKVATLQAFVENPSRVWRFHHARRDICLKATPNAAHKSLASLALPRIRQHLLPALTEPDVPPLHITQNFDGLCYRALEALSTEMTPDELSQAHERLIEMHGTALRTICLDCKAIKRTSETPLSSALAEWNDEHGEIPRELLPRCGGSHWNGSNRHGQCGSLLRPGVVWFGEVPEGQGEIVRILTHVDLLLVVGTSALVYPAAGYAATVKMNEGTVAVFNLGTTEAHTNADFAFNGPCEETIPILFATLEDLNART